MEDDKDDVKKLEDKVDEKVMKKSELENINDFCYHPHLKAKVKTKDVAELDSADSESADSADSESAITIVESEQGDVDEVGKDKKIH